MANPITVPKNTKPFLSFTIASNTGKRTAKIEAITNGNE
jgi:hypothetical protein